MHEAARGWSRSDGKSLALGEKPLAHGKPNLRTQRAQGGKKERKKGDEPDPGTGSTVRAAWFPT